jgi:hypothetical protein
MGNDATEFPELSDLSHVVHPFEQPRAIHGAIRGSGAKVTWLEAPQGQYAVKEYGRIAFRMYLHSIAI